MWGGCCGVSPFSECGISFSVCWSRGGGPSSAQACGRGSLHDSRLGQGLGDDISSTGPVGGWNGCPDPRIVAGLTRRGAQGPLDGGRQLIEFLHPQDWYGPSPLRWERRPRRLSARWIGCRARIRRRRPAEQAKHLAAPQRVEDRGDPQLRSFVVAKLRTLAPCQIAAAWMHEPDNGGMTINAENHLPGPLRTGIQACVTNSSKRARDTRSRKPRSSSLLPVRQGKSWVEGARSPIGPRRPGHLVPGH